MLMNPCQLARAVAALWSKAKAMKAEWEKDELSEAECKMLFSPFCSPQPNSLVQVGRRVVLKDLKGPQEVLNDKKGIVTVYKPKGILCQYLVKLDGGEGEMLFHVTNLKIDLAENETFNFGLITPDLTPNSSWMELSVEGLFLLRAGTMVSCGTPAICLFDDPSKSNFDTENVYKLLPYMGVTKESIEEILEDLASSTSA